MNQIRRAIVTIVGAALVLLAMSPPVAAQWRQYGAHSTDLTDRQNNGARTNFNPPGLPQGTVDGAMQSFWIGETLSDGTFFQSGFSVNWQGCGQSCYSYFTQAIDSHGNLILSWPPNGSHIGAYVGAIYTIERGVQMGPAWEWFATMHGTRYQFTTIYPPAADSGSNVPYIESELTHGGANDPLPSTADWMGPVGYQFALQTQYCSPNCVWYDSYHAAATTNFNPSCPPYNVTAPFVHDGRSPYQSVLAGNFGGYYCMADGTPLW